MFDTRVRMFKYVKHTPHHKDSYSNKQIQLWFIALRLAVYGPPGTPPAEILNPVFAEFNTVVATGNGREGLRVDADVFTAQFDGENLFDFVDFSNTVVFGW